MTANRDALEVTIASDPVLIDPVHAATINLARALADELDKQTTTGGPQTRTQATYAAQLAAIRRIVRDERADRRRTQTTAPAPASRLALIQKQAALATGKAKS